MIMEGLGLPRQVSRIRPAILTKMMMSLKFQIEPWEDVFVHDLVGARPDDRDDNRSFW